MSKPIPGGLLVAVEGIDGAGKTTQVELLELYLKDAGIAHIISKEPTRGRYGAMLRESATTGRLSLEEELELFLLDRKQHVEKLIVPSLEEGRVVVLDRYYFSTAAYQGARGADPRRILSDNREFAPEPDLLLLLDVPPAIGLSRVRNRGDEPNLFEHEHSLEVSRNIFLDITNDLAFVRRVDARKDVSLVTKEVQNWFKIISLNKLAPGNMTKEGMARAGRICGAETFSPGESLDH